MPSVPFLCSLCGSPLFTRGGHLPALCAACTETLHPWRGPACPVCGHPGDLGGDVCEECAASPIVETRVRFLYEGLVTNLVSAFKRAYNPRIVAFVADELADVYAATGWNATVVPVPASRSGRRTRGYDQMAAVARSMRRRHAIPFWNGLRRRGGEQQKRLDRSGRASNQAAVYRLRSDPPGGDIVILDDVVTTGATVRSCADTIRKAGEIRCMVLALARDV